MITIGFYEFHRFAPSCSTAIIVTDLVPFPQTCDAGDFVGLVEDWGVGAGGGDSPKATQPNFKTHTCPRSMLTASFLWITVGKCLTFLACEMGVTLVLLHKLLVRSKLVVSC